VTRGNSPAGPEAGDSDRKGKTPFALEIGGTEMKKNKAQKIKVRMVVKRSRSTKPTTRHIELHHRPVPRHIGLAHTLCSWPARRGANRLAVHISYTRWRKTSRRCTCPAHKERTYLARRQPCYPRCNLSTGTCCCEHR
jgi:hypothetical protein